MKNGKAEPMCRRVNLIFPGDTGDRAVVHRFLDKLFRGSGRVVDSCFMFGNHMENGWADARAGFTADAGIGVKIRCSWHYFTFLGNGGRSSRFDFDY